MDADPITLLLSSGPGACTAGEHRVVKARRAKDFIKGGSEGKER